MHILTFVGICSGIFGVFHCFWVYNSGFKNPALLHSFIILSYPCQRNYKCWVWRWYSSEEWPSVRTHNACSNTKHQTEIQFLKWCFSGHVSSPFTSEHKFSITNIKLNFPPNALKTNKMPCNPGINHTTKYSSGVTNTLQVLVGVVNCPTR